MRAESRVEHDAIEAVLADLLAEDLTLASYRRRLEQLYGFYAPLEDRLAVLGAFSGAEPLTTPKTPLLEADLRALGGVRPKRLPRCRTLPVLAGRPALLGCAYVLEGASLGGQVISRHVARVLGLGPDDGCRFFLGQGEETGRRWKTFTATLESSTFDRADEDAVIHAALETFRALRRWCEEAAPRG